MAVRPDRSPRRIRALADLIPDRLNANRGTPRGLEALDHSLRELGAGRAIVVDRRGRIIAGNKTAARALALGLPLQIVRSDGRRLIAVQRSDLDLEKDPRARDLAHADNRVAELDLDWNVDVLRALHESGMSLQPWWTDEEFAVLLRDHEEVNEERENAVLEPGPTKIKRGDLFQLGRHRVLCGDATSATDVTRVLNGMTPLLMVTDPPYGINYNPAWRHRHRPSQRTAVGRVMNDDRADWAASFQLFPGRLAYVWHAGLLAGVVAESLTSAGFTLRSQIIWRKQHFALSRGHYHWAHEPCWYGVRQHGTWRGDRAQTTVWDVPNLNAMGGTRTGENAATGHGTQKPVRLFEIPILNHTTLNDAIFDPFCGRARP
jgi:hypothetical protein